MHWPNVRGLGSSSVEHSVKDFITHVGNWDEERLTAAVGREVASVISRIPLPNIQVLAVCVFLAMT